MYFMTEEKKELEIQRLQGIVEELDLRIKRTRIAKNLFERELNDAYEREIVAPYLAEAGILPREGKSTT